MLELEEAVSRVLSAVPLPEVETVPLTDAHGRVVSECPLSPLNLPAFDNSSMDGFGVRAEDLAGAAAETPVRLRLVGKVAAGGGFAGEISAGTCVRLFTGSPLPRGADSVIMQEDTRVSPESPEEILCLCPTERGENIRCAGEDVRRGSVLVDAGESLTASRLGLLAAVGCERVSVNRPPLVGLLATGSELREPGQPLEPGQIYESNRVSLAALVRLSGCMSTIFPLVPDTMYATVRSLREAFSTCDAVVTSGGVSVGELDFIKPAFREIGGEVEYWKVAIKPGRPFVFGRFGKKLFFGLPGNPVSAFVTFLLLVRPALLRWQGLRDVSLPVVDGILAEPLANPGGRRHFMRVRVDAAGKVLSAGIQASHALSSAAAANGLAEVAPQTVLTAGTAVRVLRWE